MSLSVSRSYHKYRYCSLLISGLPFSNSTQPTRSCTQVEGDFRGTRSQCGPHRSDIHQWALGVGLSTARVYSIGAALPVNGHFSPVNTIECATGYGKDWQRLLKRKGVSLRSDYHKEDRWTYFIKYSTVTCRSWDRSKLKSCISKSNLSVH
jgi:hypothetical protein